MLITVNSTLLKVELGSTGDNDLQERREWWLSRIADLVGPIPAILPPLREVNHQIPLIDERKLIRYRFAKCAEYLRPQLMEKIERYTTAGWWEERNVPSAAPLMCIPKKDGKLRTVVDARERNLNTVKDVTPFPDQESIRDDVARAKFRSKLDMSDAYEQIRIVPDDVGKTAFATVVGTFISHVMQMGDCNAPATFQRLMTRLFRTLLGKSVYVYLDDIFVFSNSLEEHEKALASVFDILRTNKLYLSRKKVDLYSTKMECLGHIIDDRGIHVDSDKMRAIREWPQPQNYHDIQRFLGLVNYVAQFMPNISAYTSPLSGMSSQTMFTWNPLHERCFQTIKHIACKAPILKPIDPRLIESGQQIFLICDASPHGVGAYCGQGTDWRSCRPAGFLSKKFSNAQVSYRTYEQETLAILEGLSKWEDKLLGRPLTIVTDHKSLEFFETQGRLSNRQMRWWEYYSRFNAQITYVKGVDNVVADALSRYYASIPVGEPIPEDAYVNIDIRLDPEGDTLPLGRFVESRVTNYHPLVERVEPRVEESRELSHQPPGEDGAGGSDSGEDDLVDAAWSSGTPSAPLKLQLGGANLFELIRKGYAEDTILRKVQSNIAHHPRFKSHNGLIYVSNPIGNAVVCVPCVTHKGRRVTELILDQAHRIIGHQSCRKLLEYVRKWFWWKSLAKDVEEFCSSCGVCQTSKPRPGLPLGLLHNLPIPGRPWESIAMDFVGPFPESNGFDYLLLVIDRLSSMVHLVPTNTTAKATDIAWLFMREIVRLHGLPHSIVSDRDRKFISRFWRELHRLLGVQLLMSTAYHPQTDGASERAVRSAVQILRSAVRADQTDWVEKCPMVEFAMNSAISATTQFAPFEINYGWLPTMLPNVKESEPLFGGVKRFAEQAMMNISAVHDAIISARVVQTTQANKSRRQEPSLQVGEMVYLATQDLNLPKGRA